MNAWRATLVGVVLATSSVVVGMVSLSGPASAAPVVPAGFNDSLVASGFDLPTALSFLPDGRILVAEKSGRIMLVRTDGTTGVLVDMSLQVADYWDRGLLGFAPDPDFATNGYVYLFYPYDDGLAPDAAKTLRLTRITVVGDTASPASEVVLIGSLTSPACSATPGAGDCIPNDWYGHASGNIVFAPDKTMYVSIGDNSTWNAANDQSPRAQDVNQYPGKILRVDRLGKGLATNPFWDGNPDSVRSRVFAYGFRNPFRFDVRPGTSDVLVVGDVGWRSYEEIDVVTAGKNFGWPCYEGPSQLADYAARALCQTLYAQGAAAVTAPVITWDTAAGAASVGGPAAVATGFPSPWNQGVFYGDYAQGWIKLAATDASGAFTGATTEFATSVDSPVELEAGPNGGLFYVSIAAGELRRIAVGAAPPPVMPPGTSPVSALTPAATPVNGWGPYEPNRSNGEQGATDGGPLRVGGTTFTTGLGVHAASVVRYTVGGCSTFTAQVGVDDEVGNLGSVVFQVWNGAATKLFDSGVRTGVAAALPVSVDITGVTDLRLVVTDGGDGTAYDHADWADAMITCGPVGTPTAEILTPAPGTAFTIDSTVSFSGRGTDPQDGTLPASALSWNVTIHHCPAGNCHSHFLTSVTGASGSFVVPDHGDDTFLTLDLAVVDSEGLSSLDSQRVDLATSALTITSAPAGRSLLYEGTQVTTPFVVNVPVGSVRTVEAPTSQQGYAFTSWSDGGAAAHTVTLGAANATLTASYTPPPVPPTTTTFVSTLPTTGTPVNGWGPIERDRSNGSSGAADGRPMMIGGVAFARGLGAHAASDLRFTVPSGCTTFTAQVGVDDEVGNLGSVVFEVWNGTTTRLSTSGTRTGVDAALAVSVPLNGVSTLRLVVTDAGDGKHYDHADWADAALTCATTPPPPPPPPPPPDGQPPVLGAVTVSNVTATSATLSWTTDEASTTQAEYGATTTYGTTTPMTPAAATPVTAHSLTLTGLTATTTYQMRAISQDASGNTGRSTNVVVVTAAAPPPPPPPPATTTVFVSTLTTSATPMNGWGPMERDRSNGESAAGDGRPLTVGGVVFARGLGVHSVSDVRFTVPAGCTTFTALVGVDDEVGTLGSVVFEVWNGTTTRLYTSGTRTGADTALAVSVPLAGVSALRLVVTDAGNGKDYDHADWGDAALTCPT